MAAGVGHRFPGGRFRVEEYVDHLVRDVVGAPPDPEPGAAHPMVAFVAAQGGIGMTLEDVFAVFDAHSSDGPMLGGWSVDVTEPLRVGAEYEVRGVVERVDRKHGARTGAFDLVTVAVDLVGDDGRVHAVVRPTYVFPRRAA